MGSKLGDVSRLLRRTFDASARQIGVTRPQWQVLIMLGRHEGQNQSGMAELLDVEPISLCRMIDRLQDAELVERRRDPADRRVWRLYLTDKARALLQELRPLADQVMETALNGISAADQVRLGKLLDRIRSNLSQGTNDGQ